MSRSPDGTPPTCATCLGTQMVCGGCSVATCECSRWGVFELAPCPACATPAPEQPAPPHPNCDGCARGLPVVDGWHKSPTPWDSQRCTADRYATPGQPDGPPQDSAPPSPVHAAGTAGVSTSAPPGGGEAGGTFARQPDGPGEGARRAFYEMAERAGELPPGPMCAPYVAPTPAAPLLAAQRGPASLGTKEEQLARADREEGSVGAGWREPAAAQRGPEPVAGATTYARKMAHAAQNRWLNGPGGHAYALEAVEAVVNEVIEHERATHATETARLRGALEAVQAELGRLRLGDDASPTVVARIAALAAEGLATKETE